jgi:hypothetical protein
MIKRTLICGKVELWWEVLFVPGVDSERELEHVRDMDLVVPGVDDLGFHRAVNVLVLNVTNLHTQAYLTLDIFEM